MTNGLPLWNQSSESSGQRGRELRSKSPRCDTHSLPESVLADLERAVAYFAQHDLPFTAEMIRERLSDASREVLNSPLYVNGLGGWVQSQTRGKSPRLVWTKQFAEAQRRSARGHPLKIWRAA